MTVMRYTQYTLSYCSGQGKNQISSVSSGWRHVCCAWPSRRVFPKSMRMRARVNVELAEVKLRLKDGGGKTLDRTKLAEVEGWSRCAVCLVGRSDTKDGGLNGHFKLDRSSVRQVLQKGHTHTSSPLATTLLFARTAHTLFCDRVVAGQAYTKRTTDRHTHTHW